MKRFRVFFQDEKKSLDLYVFAEDESTAVVMSAQILTHDLWEVAQVFPPHTVERVATLDYQGETVEGATRVEGDIIARPKKGDCEWWNGRYEAFCIEAVPVPLSFGALVGS